MKKIILSLIITVLIAGCIESTGNIVYEGEMEENLMVNEVHAEHILVKTEELAKNLLDQISNGANFEDLAKKNSDCPSGQRGGDLGWFGRGMMVPEFEKSAFSLPEGMVSQPIKTQFGWHLIKVLETR